MISYVVIWKEKDDFGYRYSERFEILNQAQNFMSFIISKKENTKVSLRMEVEIENWERGVEN